MQAPRVARTRGQKTSQGDFDGRRQLQYASLSEGQKVSYLNLVRCNGLFNPLFLKGLFKCDLPIRLTFLTLLVCVLTTYL